MVRDARPLVVAAMAIMLTSASADVVRRTFDQDAVGAPPAGFSFAAARLPAAGPWLVRADGMNRYLAHPSTASTTEGFSLAVLDGMPPADLRLSARVKLVDGSRIGGLVWRYQNPENFFAVSLDLAAQEMALYRVARGNRIRLEFEDDLELDRDGWHVIRVEHADGRIRVSLGGIGVMRARDRVAAEEGRAGIWSDGAATAWFDDVHVEDAPERDR
jgi:hypothetical protein